MRKQDAIALVLTTDQLQNKVTTIRDPVMAQG